MLLLLLLSEQLKKPLLTSHLLVQLRRDNVQLLPLLRFVILQILENILALHDPLPSDVGAGKSSFVVPLLLAVNVRVPARSEATS